MTLRANGTGHREREDLLGEVLLGGEDPVLEQPSPQDREEDLYLVAVRVRC